MKKNESSKTGLIKKISGLLFCFTLSITAQNPVITNLLNDVRIDSMKKFVKQLSGLQPIVINGQPDTIKTRFAGTIGNEKAFQFIKSKFTQYSLVVDSFQFNPTGKNIMATKTGYKYPTRKFIIGAHYDDYSPTPTVAPGADDNASGTAALIEAARVFSNYNFPFTIQFIGWDEEESGLLGSAAYVPYAIGNNDTILGYINMDMLGWDGNNDSVADINTKPIAGGLALANKAMALNTTYSIGLITHLVNPGNPNTDHAPFWNNGLTAIGIDEAYDTDFNPYWHTLADSLGQFNLAYYEKVAKLAYVTLADCALDTVNVVGINDYEILDRKISIFPNPVKTILQILKPSLNKSTISIYEATGRFVNEYHSTNRILESIDVNDLEQGIYIVILLEDGNRYYSRFVKID